MAKKKETKPRKSKTTASKAKKDVVKKEVKKVVVSVPVEEPVVEERPTEKATSETLMASPEVKKVDFTVFSSFISVNARKVFMRVETSREENDIWEFFLAFSPHSDFAELFKMIYDKLPGAEVHAYIGTTVPGTMPQLRIIIKY